MKRILIAGLTVTTLFLTGCGANTQQNVKLNNDAQERIEQENIKLANDMMGKLQDPATSQLIGNIAFRNYDSLLVRYGVGGSLGFTQPFRGSDGYVRLDKLTPNTQYSYEIVADSDLVIGKGSFRTSASK